MFLNHKINTNLHKWSFFDYELEWSNFLKENNEFLKTDKELLDNGMVGIDFFSKTIEYPFRSLEPRPYQYFLAREIISLMHKNKQSDFLDFGCGAGNFSIQMASNGFNVTALDVEGNMLNFVRWRIKKRYLPIKVLNQNDLLEQYDFILALNVFEHLDNPVKEINKILNSLKSGGYLYFTFNTKEKNLDIVSKNTFENECLPLIKEQCEQAIDICEEAVSDLLWKKK